MEQGLDLLDYFKLITRFLPDQDEVQHTRLVSDSVRRVRRLEEVKSWS